ncbi:hypothetical protein BV22DRAFT_336094 [Leucogyrophana mollusca]|uniref:Uncharacterized protein n=1 Tax=Leucogyrophana mollusca TaxID=85980 RepID=A0ACB8BPE7_9AGAM|nr:hypothetical protein BV22DRAFT_336094 [Leucogyrophana mollusca]
MPVLQTRRGYLERLSSATLRHLASISQRCFRRLTIMYRGAERTAALSLVSDILQRMKHEDRDRVDQLERAVKLTSSTTSAAAQR